ncbi:hypothetical protein BT69DRAFT_1353766 [Atractiella rhizophila]|nr:hypothetical protein BT69DRAFT_1353766 [Atractiella rhizophila]
MTASSLPQALRHFMRSVPQPIFTLTSPLLPTHKVLLSSFSSISLSPPLVSFAILTGGRMDTALQQNSRAEVALLEKEGGKRRWMDLEMRTRTELKHVVDGGISATHGAEEEKESTLWIARVVRLHEPLDGGMCEPLVTFKRGYWELGTKVR